MKKIFFIMICPLVILNAFPQNIKKGFKQLEKSDYEKARDFFSQEFSVSGDNPAANFGLAVIYADEKSPYYNLIDAWSYARTTEKNIKNLSEEDREIISEYFANTEIRRSSWPANKKMMQAIGAIEAKMIKYIREENNLQLAYDVIEKFPDFRYYRNVIHIRNQLEFRKYEKQNTLEGYLEFMQKFPEAAQIGKAVKYRNKLAFEKVKNINTVEAYETYMKNYPGSADFGEALKLRNAAAFRQAKQKNTVEAFDDFITKYHDALEIPEAKKIQQQLLYEYAKKIQTLEAYNAFIAKYPEGSQYIDIFNLKSLDLGMKFYNTSGLNWNNIAWSRSFDNNGFPETAGGLAITAINKYIVTGNTMQNDSLYKDAWVLKLDENGKMIWNKVLGGPFNDSVFMVILNGDQDILVLGYTWITPDSASKEAWIFKLDNDGRKIWTRSLGKWNITSAVVNSENEIFIGGYKKNDSLENKYNLTVINNSGIKLWQRTYTSTGEINDMFTGMDGNILTGGSKWIFKMDRKGYLLWEYPLGMNDSLTCMNRLNDGTIIAGGQRVSTGYFFLRLDNSGKKLWEKFYPSDQEIPSSVESAGNSGFICSSASGYGRFLTYFNAEGNQIKRLEIPLSIGIQSLKTDTGGNLIIQMTTGENITLLKNSGTTL